MMNLKKLIWIVTVHYFFFLIAGCMTKQSYVSINDEKTSNIFNEKDKIRIIPLVYVDVCTAFSEELPEQITDETSLPECLEFKTSDWIPAEFIHSPFFRFEGYYGGRRIPLLYNLPYFLSRDFPDKSELKSGLYYKPFQSIQAYKDFEKKNTIVIRYGSVVRKANLSSYFATFTLTILPGYFDELEDNEIFLYDSEGKKSANVSSNLISSHRIWLGVIFFLWGPAVAADESDVLHDTIESIYNHYLQKVE